MDSEGITQAVRANVMYPAGLGVDKLWQSGSFAAVPQNLPTAVAVNAENQFLPVSNNRTTPANIFLEQFQGIRVNRQHALPAVPLLFALTYLYLDTAFGAKGMSRAKSRSAHLAGKFDAALQMLNDYRAVVEVYVLDL
jgi:hypothetical protein